MFLFPSTLVYFLVTVIKIPWQDNNNDSQLKVVSPSCQGNEGRRSLKQLGSHHIYNQQAENDDCLLMHHSLTPLTQSRTPA